MRGQPFGWQKQSFRPSVCFLQFPSSLIANTWQSVVLVLYISVSISVALILPLMKETYSPWIKLCSFTSSHHNLFSCIGMKRDPVRKDTPWGIASRTMVTANLLLFGCDTQLLEKNIPNLAGFMPTKGWLISNIAAIWENGRKEPMFNPKRHCFSLPTRQQYQL